jgi:hypothetical protein
MSMIFRNDEPLRWAEPNYRGYQIGFRIVVSLNASL